MESIVFQKVKKIFEESVKSGLIPVLPITEDLIKIVNLGSTGIRAEVCCVFCACNHPNARTLAKKIRVQCEIRGPNAKYWNLIYEIGQS